MVLGSHYSSQIQGPQKRVLGLDSHVEFRCSVVSGRFHHKLEADMKWLGPDMRIGFVRTWVLTIVRAKPLPSGGEMGYPHTSAALGNKDPTSHAGIVTLPKNSAENRPTQRAAVVVQSQGNAQQFLADDTVGSSSSGYCHRGHLAVDSRWCEAALPLGLDLRIWCHEKR